MLPFTPNSPLISPQGEVIMILVQSENIRCYFYKESNLFRLSRYGVNPSEALAKSKGGRLPTVLFLSLRIILVNYPETGGFTVMSQLTGKSDTYPTRNFAHISPEISLKCGLYLYPNLASNFPKISFALSLSALFIPIDILIISFRPSSSRCFP